MNETTVRTCVGWLNVDSYKELKNPDDASEAKYGTNYFWPKYKKCKDKIKP